MIDIGNTGIIKIIRGDTVKIPLCFKDYFNCKHEMCLEDCVYFAIMEPNQKFEDAIIKKKYTVLSEESYGSGIQILLKSCETKNLKPGKYYYSVKMVSEHNKEKEVNTLIPCKEFWIME